MGLERQAAMATPQAPAGLGPKAKRIWKETLATYELRADELRILEDACREVDLIERMEAELGDSPLIVKGSMGQPAPSPLVTELRQHRNTYRSLIKALGLPEETDSAQAQKRSVTARAAAQARWRKGA